MTDEVISEGIIQLRLDDERVLTDTRTAVEGVRKEVETLNSVEGSPEITLADEKFKTALKKAGIELDKIDSRSVGVAVGLKLKDFDAAEKELKLKLLDLEAARAEIEVDVKDKKAKAKLLAIEKEVAKHLGIEIDVRASDRTQGTFDEIYAAKKDLAREKLVFQVEAHGVERAIAEAESLKQSELGLLATEERLTTEYDKKEKIRTLAALNLAKEDAKVASLAQKYKVLGERINTIDPNKTISVGIDRSKLEADQKVLEEELAQFGDKGDLALKKVRELDFTPRDTKQITEFDRAKEEAQIARLAQKYKDLTNEIDHSEYSAIRLFQSSKNIELGIDKKRFEADRKLVEHQLIALGEKGKEALKRAFDTSGSDTTNIERIGNVLGKLGDAGEKITKLRINAGPFSGSIQQIGSAAVVAGPLVTSLAGSLSSLVGVLGAGALGAGAAAGGILGGLAVNFGPLAGAVHHVTGEYEAGKKAAEHWEEAVRKFGPGSKQALSALAQYHSELAQMDPAVAKAVVAVHHLAEEFNKALLPTIRTDFSKILENVGKTGSKLLPTITKNSTEAANILTAHVDDLIKSFREPKGIADINKLGKGANDFLKPALDGAEKFTKSLVHIAAISAELFGGKIGNQLRKWGQDFENATKNNDKLRKTLEGLGHDAEKVLNFFIALSKVVFDFFKSSVKAGGEFTDNMTEGLEKWDKFEKSTEGKNKLSEYFKESIKFTEVLFHTLKPIVQILTGWSVILTPFAKDVVAIIGYFTNLFQATFHGKQGLESFAAVAAGLFVAFKFGTIISGFGRVIGYANELRKLVEATGFKKAAFDVVTGKESLGKNLRQTGNLEREGEVFQTRLRKALAEGGSEIAAQIKEALGVGGSKAAAEQEAAVTAGGTKSAAEQEAAITAGGTKSAAEQEAAIISGGTVAAERIGAAEIAGGIPGGVPGGKGLLGTAEKAAVPAAEVGLLSKLGGGLIKGGTIGIGGLIATEVLSSLVGGKAGHTISNIGKGASIGAGIGAFFPEFGGPLAGAAVGGGIAGLKELLGGSTRTSTGSRLEKTGINADLIKKLEKREKELDAQVQKPAEHLNYDATQEIKTPLTRAQRDRNRQIQGEKADVQGQLAGLGFANEGFKQFPDFNKIVIKAKETLAALPPAGRQSAIGVISEFVKVLEKEGRVLPHSLGKLLNDVRPELAGFSTAGEIAGRDFHNSLLRNIKSHLIQNEISSLSKDLAKKWGDNFGLLPISTHESFTKVITAGSADLAKLKDIMKTGTAQQREAASAEYQKLAPELHGYLATTRKGVEEEIGTLTKNIKKLGPEGPHELEHAYARAREVLEAEAKLTGENVDKAIGKLNKEYHKELREFTSAGENHEGPEPSGSVTGHMRGRAATGGMWQWGNAGEKGNDKIRTSLMVAPGEVGAVFTHQQQEVANAYLDPIGGLQGLFNSYKTPHYMAQGGLVGTSLPLPRQYLSAGTVDQGVDYAAPAGTPEYAMGRGRIIKEGISGFGPWAPVLQITAGPLAGKEIYYGHAGPNTVKVGKPVDAGEQITQVGAGRVGISTGPHLEIGFYPPGPNGAGGAMLGLINSMLGGHGAISPTGVGGIAAAVSHAVYKALKEPKLGGAGNLSTLGQAALHVVTQHANKALKAAAARVNASGPGAYGGEVAGPVVTASNFGGHNDPSAFNHQTASGKIANDSLMGFAELSNPPGSLNFSALGHLPMGSFIKVSYNGRTIRIPKVDVGAGGPGIGGHVRAIDLTYAANRALGAPGLENVKWQRAAQGALVPGKYNQPALLVGEHDNEYVINPRKADNGAYLKQAAADMGYMVTPAKAGKPSKTPVKHASAVSRGEEANLQKLAPFAEKRGIPASVIEGTLHKVEKGLTAEKNAYHSVQVKRDKALEKFTKGNKKAERSLRETLESGNRSVVKTREAAAEAERKAAAAQGAASKFPKNPGEPNPGLESANRSAANAKTTAARSVRNAEASAAARLKKAHAADAERRKTEEANIKKLDKGLRAIRYGGEYEHTKFQSIKHLEAEQRTGRSDLNKLRTKEKEVKNLNKEITDHTRLLNILQGRYEHSTDPTKRASLKDEWHKIFGVRKEEIAELKAIIGDSQKAAIDFNKISPSIDVENFIEAVTPELRAIEDTENEQAATEEHQIGSDEKQERPTTTTYLEKWGPAVQRNLEEIEERSALAATKVVPDNPNTPVNEELPGLEAELGPAQSLKEFWEKALVRAQSERAPEATITEFANDVTSARSSFFSLKQNIENLKKGTTSQILQESNAFSQARLELFKNFGSNFAPVFQSVSPGFKAPGIPTAIPGPTSTANAQPVKHETTNVHVTNNFAEGPQNTHHWSQGLAFDLQAAF